MPRPLPPQDERVTPSPDPRPEAQPSATPDDPSRRSLLKLATCGLAVAVGTAVAAPAALLLAHPLRKKTVTGGEEPIPVAALERLPEGVPVAAKVVAPVRRDAWQKQNDVALGAVWLVRHGERVECLSSVCPHAGCFIDYEEKEQRFLCPCHGSTFALDGKRTAGPAPRDMDTLATEVRAGKVLVRFQRFRQASPKKVAL